MLRTDVFLFLASLALSSAMFAGASAAEPPGGSLRGAVFDASGAAVEGALVTLTTGDNVALKATATDAEGRFALLSPPSGAYVLTVRKSGFEEIREVIEAGNGEANRRIVLRVEAASETVTVTAVRGGEAQSVQDTSEFVTTLRHGRMSDRTFLFLPQALKQEPGVFLQQTSTSQGSPFVRGLTGQYVVNFIDGIRFNDAIFRPGANQYTALIQPFFLDGVEILHGPMSVQYGSDAIGGAVGALSSPAALGDGKFTWMGSNEAFFNSGDRSAGSGLRLGGSGKRWGFSGAGTMMNVEDLRTGGAIDSHSVVTRLLGISSRVLGDRLRQTGFMQYGAQLSSLFALSDRAVLTFNYMRGQQLNAQRFDQLDGGAGNLIAGFDPQILDFAVLRYRRAPTGPLDSVSGSLSYLSIRDDRTSQSINNKTGIHSPIQREYNLDRTMGLVGQFATHLGTRNAIAAGTEYYDDFIESTRRDSAWSNSTRDFTTVSVARGRFPNHARYRSVGLFAVDTVRLLPERLIGRVGLRYSRVGYRQTPDGNPVSSSGVPGVPRFHTTFEDLTYHAGGVLRIANPVNLTGNFSRGFRAPNVNDMGSIGLSGAGFEVSPEESVRLNAKAGRFDPTRQYISPVAVLTPEVVKSYEAGVKVHGSSGSAELALFQSDISSLIERRTVLLPPGAVGTVIGGQPITKQDPNGAVYTALASGPVFVRVNAGRVQLRGFEVSTSLKLPMRLGVDASAAYTKGLDKSTNLPPSLENGMPPLAGTFGLRWQAGGRYWVEAYTFAAAAQRRLSDNDLAQVRIAGPRSKDEISSFFANGAVARGLVSNGVLLPTGENLNAVLQRVLGPGLRPNYMYNHIAGFATLNFRGGYRLTERSRLMLSVENVLDKNYRLMASGIDSPGRTAGARYSIDF